MELIEKIIKEVEQLRDTRGIPFNEVVCYSNVLRIIKRELENNSSELNNYFGVENLQRLYNERINIK